MTIDELHDYCRYLCDENHVHGVPDKWSEGYEFALSLVMFKCHEGLTDENRKAVQQLRYATPLAIRALDIDKQDENSTIESTAKVSDKVLELLASSKTAESEQTENPKQTAGREIDTSEYPFIQLEADELVRMICDAYQTGVFSGKEQS